MKVRTLFSTLILRVQFSYVDSAITDFGWSRPCFPLWSYGPFFPYTDASRDEENWRAQYGQVVHSREEPVPDFHAVDLWDWEMVKGSRKVGKGQEARLAGQLVKRSAKSHPSMPSSCIRFRTAPICEVHLDLVRVRTGSDFASFSR